MMDEINIGDYVKFESDNGYFEGTCTGVTANMQGQICEFAGLDRWFYQHEITLVDG